MFTQHSICQHFIQRLSAELATGPMVKNYPSFPDSRVSKFIRFSATQLSDGLQAHHRYYKFPQMGASITFADLGNRSIFGKLVGVNYDFSLRQHFACRFFIEERLSLGVAWYSRPFNANTNPNNIAIGSRFTAFVSAAFLCTYSFSQHDLLAGITLYHGSNSHVAIPNLGINIPAITLGYRYTLKPVAMQENTATPTYNRKWHLNVRMALGLNEQGTSVAAVDGPLYPIYISGMYISKRTGYIHRVSIGCEAWYNTGVDAYVAAHSNEMLYDKSAAFAAQGVINHEFLFPHFSLVTQGGIYFYNPFYKNEYKSFYNGNNKAYIKTLITAKLGLQYYFKNLLKSDNTLFYVGTYVKTNFGQADFWENGIGFQF